MTSKLTDSNAKFTLHWTNEDYQHWSWQTRLPQLRYMNFFTALLYLLYAYFESRMNLPFAGLRFALHGFFIPVFLLFICRLSYFPARYKLMRWLLIAAPVSAVWFNLYVNMGTPLFAHFAPEIYLNIIWTFTMAGLSLPYALLAVGCSLSGALVMTYLHWDKEPSAYLHCLWLLSAFVFGLVTAIVLERMMRAIYQQKKQLEYSASTDTLTGLWNRKMLLQRFNREVAENQADAHYSVLMLDIDHFKQVNDEFGHVVGDKVLSEFADLIKRCIGKQGHVGRFGGEEFCILLPGFNHQQAYHLAKELLTAINQCEFSQAGKKTASIGVCQHQDDEDFEACIIRADEALYQAKALGRNQVQPPHPHH